MLRIIYIIICFIIYPVNGYTLSVHCWNPTNPKKWQFGEYWSTSKPSNSDFFEPKVRVEHKLCAFNCCSSEVSTLRYYGECNIFWGTGMVRACARLAKPGEHGNPDPTYIKLGTYEDPMVPADGNDWVANNMPFHKKTPAPGVGGQEGQALLLSAAFVGLINPGLGAILAVGGGLAKLAEVASSHINYVVNGHRGNFVDVPLAPYPPPYCSRISGTTILPDTKNICMYNYATNYKQNSTNNKICELGISTKYSTFDKPMLRLVFNNIIRVCDSDYMKYYNNYLNTGEDPNNKFSLIKNKSIKIKLEQMTPECVIFKNIDPVDQSTIIKLNQDNASFIKTCNNDNTLPCIEFPGFNKISNKSYRTLYQVRNASNQIIDKAGYTPFIIPPQDGSLKLIAIDFSDFQDFTVNFPNGQRTSNTDIKNLTDIMGNSSHYSVKNAQTIDTNGNTVPDPTTICAYDNKQKNIGCVARPSMPKPIVANAGVKKCQKYGNKNVCLEQYPPDNGKKPTIVFGLGYKDFQQSFLQYDENNHQTKYVHGYPFNIFLADNQNSQMDKKGNCIGNYIYASNHKTVPKTDINKNAILKRLTNSPVQKEIYINGQKILYQDGIEYINGKYIRGATKICLSGYVGKDQVLSKKNEFGHASQALNMRIIPPYKSSQTAIIDKYHPLKHDVNGNVIYSGDMIDYPEREGGKSKYINSNYEAVRPKNALEHGLCVDMPRPKCNATYDRTNSYEVTYWPESDVNPNKIIKYKCLLDKGKIAMRRCIKDPNNPNKGIFTKIDNPCIFKLIPIPTPPRWIPQDSSGRSWGGSIFH